MSTTLWLRIAAVIQLVFTAGHSMGGLSKWSPMGDNDVLHRMTTVRFSTMGVQRSYLDFFMGFGWLLAVVMLMEAVLFWQVGSLVRTQPLVARPMIAVFIVVTVAAGILSWRFLFPVPALFTVAVAIPLAIAYVQAGRAAIPA